MTLACTLALSFFGLSVPAVRPRSSRKFMTMGASARPAPRSCCIDFSMLSVGSAAMSDPAVARAARARSLDPQIQQLSRVPH